MRRENNVYKTICSCKKLVSVIFQNCIRDNQNFVCLFATIRPFVIAINPFAPEPPVTARADPGPFYPLWRHQF